MVVETFLSKLLFAFFVFGLCVVVAHFLKGKIRRLGAKVHSTKQDVITLLSYTAYVAILAVGAITSLGIIGVNIAALVAGLGLTGFAVGFAFKDIISNLLAGILIILYSPFKVGSVIKVGAYEGKVIEINLRYTVVRSDDENIILVPNSTMLTNIIIVKGS